MLTIKMGFCIFCLLEMELLLTGNVNVPTVGKGVVIGIPVANGKI